MLPDIGNAEPSPQQAAPVALSGSRRMTQTATAQTATGPAQAVGRTRAERRALEAHWKRVIARFQEPHRGRAIWQLVNTLGSYVGLWALMYLCLDISWWLVVPLAVLSGGFLVRAFIIFHDCGHGSFFRSRRANDFWGAVTGMLTFTPYYQWRGEHAMHHGTTGNLDRRGVGDVWTATVEEYLAFSRRQRLAYRLSRNPIVLFGIAPLVLFLIIQRFPPRGASREERRSVWMMNVAVTAMVVAMGSIFGFLPYMTIQLIVMCVAGTAGLWLFYLQHQFEDAYWERGGDWDYTDAALKGSSFFKLPRILQWFSGNIGFHHIHHLSPRIPNYNLERCHQSDPLFHEVEPMTLMQSLKSIGLRLWDESSQKLVGFRHLRERRQAAAAEQDQARRPG
jgi:acyl-lipid omega-6 desaturase (Delta-12 desaturase)